MVSSVWLFFTVSQEDYRAAKCKTCGAQFQRSGEKRKSFYTSIMMSHLRSCHRYDSVWKEYQEAKMLTRNRSVRAGEKKMEENDGKQPGPSTTTLNKEEANGLWTVTCGDKTGLLDISKLRKSVACIKCEGQWFSPPAFEEFGGKKASKKWKVTIYYKDKPLRYWFMKGYLSTKGSYKRSVECLKETTNLPSDLISDHLSDGNSAATTVSKSPARSPEEPGSSSKDSWCQPLDADMLVEEDCPKTNDASSPAVEGPTSPVPDVEEQVKPTQSPKIKVEMREIQCVTESEPSSPATTAPDIPEVIAAEKIQITQVKSESTDADQTKLKISPASDPGVPGSPPAPSPPPSAGCDLDTMDLHQLKREKLKMQIKVLRLQEEYYARKLGGPLT